MLPDLITRSADGMAERNWLPDPLIRAGIRRLCRQRLENVRTSPPLAPTLTDGPIAEATDAANDQHYEVDPDFFGLVLGPHRKYSSGYWSGAETLADAEAAALTATCERADLSDGQNILELGCGWGSLTLWMAEHYPTAQILAVSNSAPQRRYIEDQARDRGLENLSVQTCDINDFQTHRRFDRVVSVEMFEHLRNYRLILERIGRWLSPEGRLFLHVFSHRRHGYRFEPTGAADWMARQFFTGGIMPSHELITHFDQPLALEKSWRGSGTHYERTANAWLAKLDAHRDRAREVLARTHPDAIVDRQLQRWRIFFMACAELFGYDGGREWGVSHWRLAPTAAISREAA